MTLRHLFLFFLPLAGSATLVTLSHLIINGTLARSPQPELVISSYAIAISLYAVLERPVILLRPTSSALVKDQRSFGTMLRTSLTIIAIILTLSSLMSYTSIGVWTFKHGFGVTPDQMDRVIDVYQVLMWVTLFSGIRCLFHGIIISRLQTKWMTIGMIIRLIGMVVAAAYFLVNGVESGVAGAVIFLVGMAIECVVASLEGIKLTKELPVKEEKYAFAGTSQIMSFYRPLVYATLFAITIQPLINAQLGHSYNAQLAIASYSVALTIIALLLSLSTYVHQIVLNFYTESAAVVRRFALLINFVPVVLLGGLMLSPLGEWTLRYIMGVEGELLEASKMAMIGLALYVLCFPWVDYANGLLMWKGHTKVMTYTQISNVATVIVTLWLLLRWWPGANGLIGALALSMGTAAELAVAAMLIQRTALVARMKRAFLQRSG